MWTELPFAGRRRRARLRAVHQPVRNLLQLFKKLSPSRRQEAVCRDHAAKPSKEMPNLQVVLRTKGKEPALLPKLCRRPKAEESRRAPAQETGGTASGRSQGVGLRWRPLRKAQKHRPRRQPRLSPDERYCFATAGA